jgi:hypothetical protein
MPSKLMWSEHVKNLMLGLSAVIASVAIPVVGIYYTNQHKERELGKNFIEMGTRILSEKPTPDTKPLRDWAIDMINRYAEVRIPESVRQALLTDQSLFQSRGKKIDELQERGISALLEQDFKGALAAYDAAYVLWPTYRNVDEIRRAIIDASKLPDSPNWQALYRKIRDMDLRGTSQDLRKRLAAESGG